MTAKEKAIREAYGEHYETVKQDVDENGWLYHPKGGEVTFDPWIGLLDEHPTNDAYRPKSLAGIENNNGWIQIESEADLPKERGVYWTITTENKTPSANSWFTFGKPEWSFDNYIVTHYQSIIKPNLPIY